MIGSLGDIESLALTWEWGCYREPPTIHGRIQSVKRTDLSVGIGGDVDVPPRDMPVSCLPTDIKQDLKWILEYQP